MISYIPASRLPAKY